MNTHNPQATTSSRIDYILPDARLILFSLKPSPSRAVYFPEYQNINRMYETWAQRDEEHIFYVPIWDRILAGGTSYFKADNVHLNPRGYRILHDALYPVLEKSWVDPARRSE